MVGIEERQVTNVGLPLEVEEVSDNGDEVHERFDGDVERYPKENAAASAEGSGFRDQIQR